MYTALYREWRPMVFEELIGQENIVTILKNQIMTGRIPHAYLFCGTRGTGKTTTAKILSKAVNCLSPAEGDPCGECEMCMEINAGTLIDVVEIDAASNNRVENIRDLIEDVKYPPHNAKYKVYIIDEVHMLSISAFNALLKTLEEPPKHVIFILATTDPQKVPPTILSRCQRFDFKRIKTEDIFKRLRRVVDENGIFAEDKTLKMISKVCDGAMRDALSILDQCMSMSMGKIEYNDVVAMLGLTSNEHIFSLTEFLINKDIEASINKVDDIILGGKDINLFIKDMVKHFRNLLMVKVSKKPEEIIDASEDTIALLKEQAKIIRSEEIMRSINLLIEAENETKGTSQPRIILEMTLIKLCRREYDSSPEMILNRISRLEERLKSGEYVITKPEKNSNAVPDGGAAIFEAQNENKEKEIVIENDDEINIAGNQEITLDEIKNTWQDVIGHLNANKNKVVSMLMSQGEIVSVKGHIITIEFNQNYSINKKILDQPDKKKIAEEAISKCLNKSARLNFAIEKKDFSMDESIENVKKLLGDDIVEIIE